MEDKKITEIESIEIISTMINRTRERYLGSGNIMLMWGYLVVIATVLVWVMLDTTHNGDWNWLWFAIPVVGGIATPIMARKEKEQKRVTTYSDMITSKLWTIFGLSEGVLILMCLVAQLGFGVNCWIAMMVYSFIVAAFAEIVEGIIIREKSLVVGGSLGLLLGMVMLCCSLAGVPMYANIFLPMFMLGFVCMMIIPGHVINYKARRK